MEALFDLLYPHPTPNRIRDRPMEVLALGMSRTGTESLREALIKLGYGECYHAFVNMTTHIDNPAAFVQLIQAKFKARDRGKPFHIMTSQFDRLLGDCAAVTDAPCNMLASELVAAYPNAKVVLNRRSDVDAWEKSFRDTVISQYRSWLVWLLSWFDSQLFWTISTLSLLAGPFFYGDFGKNSQVVYREHYEMLEAQLRSEGRPWLDWTVEDGWEPLCQFLGKEVPEEPFPEKNASAGFEAKVHGIIADSVKRATRNIAIGFTAVIAATLYRVLSGAK